MTATLSRPRIAQRLPHLARRLLVPKLLVPAAFVASAIWMAWQASHVTSFVWLIDEALYVKEAQAYSELQGFFPHVHGHRNGVPNILFPALLAPLYALFSSPTAFELAHILNGVAWASTLFPVYLLTRRIGAPWPWALFAGLMSVWVPWAVAVNVMMTEAVTYPAFAWAIYAMTVAVADPRPKHDGLALLAILVTILGRTQFIVLLPVLLLSILGYSLSLREAGRPWWRRLRGHWALGILIAAGTLGVFLLTLIDSTFLGGYSITTGLPPLPNGLWLGGMQHLAHVVVGVGILPAILFVAWLTSVAARPAVASPERAFAVVGTVALVVVIYVGAFFMQNVGAVMQERYVSYAAPLLVVGTAVFLASRHSAGARLSVLAGAVLAVGAIAGAPFIEDEAANAFNMVANGNAAYAPRMIGPLEDLTSALPGRLLRTVESLALITLLLGVATAVVLSLRRPLRDWLVAALCLGALWFTVDQTRFVVPRAVLGIDTGFPYSLTGVREVSNDWADQAVPDDALVGMHVGRLRVPDEQNQWLWTTFWNKRIQRTYSFDGNMPYSGWAGDKWTLDEATGALETEEAPDYLVASQVEPVLRVEGEIVANSSYNAVVIKASKPLRARWAMRNAEGSGSPRDRRRPMQLLFFPRPGEDPPKVTITLNVDALPPEQGDLKLSVPFSVDDGRRVVRGRIRNNTLREVTVQARPTADGPAVVTIANEPQRFPGGQTTLRVIGVSEAP